MRAPLQPLNYANIVTASDGGEEDALNAPVHMVLLDIVLLCYATRRVLR